MTVDAPSVEAGDRDRYLHLLKLTLTGLTAPDPRTAVVDHSNGSVHLQRLPAEDLWKRAAGVECYPVDALTMIGIKRLDNLQTCIEDVLERDVPGDLIETGVWRGGATIFMRALLAVHGVRDRILFAADSFEGLPPPDAERYPADVGHNFNLVDYLSVPLEEVKRNFERFALLDDQVRFVQGWFRDTLPALSDRTWSVVRLDGDLYESTINALENLYPHLSPGGYLIVDDYSLAPCRQAVDDYRTAEGIGETVRAIDESSAFWRREA